MSFSELAVLSRLDREGPLTSARLAALERVTAQAIGTIPGGLHRRGLVARDPDPADGRRVITSITGKGRDALASRDLLITERLAAAVDTLTPEERRRLADALPILAVLAAWRTASKVRRPGRPAVSTGLSAYDDKCGCVSIC
ncbi:MarR family winged helix-turn-helix transcriptional regulator [Nonomuraea rhodomycinica]|uniref:MarR family winged helix-turn-helix transcriptional regulator n=1 Tax=Nonomuraea rhodomycinica TaxID=1712872 RepID=UPI001C379BCD|nr:MarR family transcriptional regulator [Nonomuraea rhodomycinica]